MLAESLSNGDSVDLMDSEVAPNQRTKQPTQAITLEHIRDAIPKHCFIPSALTSGAHIILNVSFTAALGIVAFHWIPPVSSDIARWTLWLFYSYLQGLLLTGIWILAHECGHQALFQSPIINDGVGFVLHSALLVPYFSWKYTHARHHRYTNNMDKDTAFVPAKATEKGLAVRIANFTRQNQDAPAFAATLLVLHQLVGWPMYLLCYVTGGEHSLPNDMKISETSTQSHFNPMGEIWLEHQKPFILLSDAGLLAMLGCLYFASSAIGASQVSALYFVPYLWVNNWLVAITYLHHTHPNVLHFDNEKWTYLDGALSTVDRPYGFIGKHMLHGIIDFHVVHHLFPRIPFYHAEEATKAIIPVLGERYRQERSSFWGTLWKTFKTCNYVTEMAASPGSFAWQGS